MSHAPGKWKTKEVWLIQQMVISDGNIIKGNSMLQQKWDS